MISPPNLCHVGRQGPVIGYHMKINGKGWDNLLRNWGKREWWAVEAGWRCYVGKNGSCPQQPVSGLVLLTPRSMPLLTCDGF